MEEVSLLNKIRADLLVARKARDTNSVRLLNPLLSDASAPGLNNGKRESTDAEVIKVINGFVSGINECISRQGGSATAEQLHELSILKGYLPELMSTQELEKIIDDIIAENGYSKISDMKGLMSALSKYAGRYDGNTAGQLAKSKLAAK